MFIVYKDARELFICNFWLADILWVYILHFDYNHDRKQLL